MNELAYGLRFAAALGVVAALLVALRYGGLALQRGRARSDSRYIAVLETAYLPGGASIHVVRAGERTIVVGRCASGIATLAELGGRPGAGTAGALHET